jgi:hypothetical protein
MEAMPAKRPDPKPKTSDAKMSLTIDGESGVADPTPSRVDLASAHDVRLEMARIYRSMKAKEIDSGEGAKLVWVLAQIGKMIEVHEIERRVTELEERASVGRSPPAPAARTH